VKRARARDRAGHFVAGALGPLILRALSWTLRVSYAGRDRLARARDGGAPVP